MLKQLKVLPPRTQSKPLKLEQVEQINDVQNSWYWVMARIDWLQKEQLGFCLPDPLDNPEFTDIELMYRMFDVESRYRFAQLQICIAGWELIKQAAEENRRKFPFNNPRELFATICLQEKEYQISDMLNGSEGGLEKQRENLRTRSSFYRGRLNNQADSQKLKLHQELFKLHQKSSLWENFIIYAIWDQRYSSYKKSPSSPRMCEVWQRFLQAHKDFTAFWSNKGDVDGYRLCLVAWREGQGFDPKTNKRIC